MQECAPLAPLRTQQPTNLACLGVEGRAVPSPSPSPPPPRALNPRVATRASLASALSAARAAFLSPPAGVRVLAAAAADGGSLTTKAPALPRATHCAESSSGGLHISPVVVQPPLRQNAPIGAVQRLVRTGELHIAPGGGLSLGPPDRRLCSSAAVSAAVLPFTKETTVATTLVLVCVC